jgi:hypothetical protein
MRAGMPTLHAVGIRRLCISVRHQSTLTWPRESACCSAAASSYCCNSPPSSDASATQQLVRAQRTTTAHRKGCIVRYSDITQRTCSYSARQHGNKLHAAATVADCRRCQYTSIQAQVKYGTGLQTTKRRIRLRMIQTTRGSSTLVGLRPAKMCGAEIGQIMVLSTCCLALLLLVTTQTLCRV